MNALKSEDFNDENEKTLPIFKYENEIIEAVRDNQFVIIHGQTGCGKSTQIPQFLLKHEINAAEMIGITQPRRLAVISMAKKVASEMETNIGKIVGYEIRFDRKCYASTKIKYMTDGILMNECILDQNLNDYKIIMVDEAHERSVTSDVLLGLLKRISIKRKDLKIIVSSATINVDKFVAYFGGCAQVINVESNMYKVDVIYHDFRKDYIEKIVEIVEEIHHEEEKLQEEGGFIKGDILVFLTGQEEIYMCCESLKTIKNVVPKPLCSVVKFDNQKEAFEPVCPYETKVVVATNIAETSLTIEGIKYVIDFGYVKQKNYNANRLLEVLEDVRISKAQADQRKGRAGRTQEGICHRLYKESTYNSFQDEAIPEIYRKNLCETYLKLRAINIDPKEFEFLDVPKEEELNRSEKELIDLRLMDNTGTLTEMGDKIAALPIHPILGKVLMTSLQYQCTAEVIQIVAMFSEKIQYIFDRPRNKLKAADSKHYKFQDPNGDHFTLLNVFNKWNCQKNRKKWCYDNYINDITMEYVAKVIKQIRHILKRSQIKVVDKPSDTLKVDDVKKCFIAGYFKNICIKTRRDVYIRTHDLEVFNIHGSSTLKDIKPKIILFHDALKSTRSFACSVMQLEEDFLRKHFLEELKLINFPDDVDEIPSF